MGCEFIPVEAGFGIIFGTGTRNIADDRRINCDFKTGQLY